jgi:hypothetical protein
MRVDGLPGVLKVLMCEKLCISASCSVYEEIFFLI